MTKKELMKDLKFCQDLMNRLVKFAESTGEEYWTDKHSVIVNDIIRLRRELNNVRLNLGWGCRDK